MKKRLESELISIAHRILKLKNKSNVEQLYKETQKLYETLSVLKFYQDNFESVKNSVSQQHLEEKLEKVATISEAEETEVKQDIADADDTDAKINSDGMPENNQEEEKIVLEVENSNNISEEKEEEVLEEENSNDPSEENQEENVEIVYEEHNSHEESEEDSETEEEATEAQDLRYFEPHFELEEALEANKVEMPKQISFEDFLGKDYIEPVFVKPNELITKVASHFDEIPADESNHQIESAETIKSKSEIKEEKKGISINDKFSAGINIGLNDRIAFVKKLFAGSDEDYNRVISQLNTFDTLQEAEVFIEDMVKPDYNDWKGNDEYEARFIELISKKFV